MAEKPSKQVRILPASLFERETRIKDGIPQKDDVFDAFTVSHGNLARCSPFTCTGEDSAFIYADDEEGDPFVFRKAQLILVSVVLLVIAGCITATDPNTGQTTYQVDPNSVAKIEPLVQTGITIGQLLAPLFPVIVPALTLVIGGFGIWLKIKPQVTKAQNRATLLHTGVSSLVVAIDELKKLSPESWEKLRAEIKVGPEIENIIRAIRGLPPLS